MTTGRVRRLAVGMLMGLAVALALLGTGARDASAQPIKGVQDQNGFVDTCRELGGTPHSIGPRSVKCSYQNGASMSCNFANGGDVNACVTYIPPTGRTVGGGDTTGGQTSGSPGDAVATGNATIVADEPASGGTGDGSMIPLE